MEGLSEWCNTGPWNMWMYLFFTVQWGILWKWMSHYTHTELTSNCVGFPVWVVSCASPILPCQYYCASTESTKWHWQKCRGWHMRLLAAATYHIVEVCASEMCSTVYATLSNTCSNAFFTILTSNGHWWCCVLSFVKPTACVPKNCMNGGTQDPDTCDCVCPPEYTGADCGGELLTLQTCT